jgi:hypothetical protein
MGKLSDLASSITDADQRAGEALNAAILKDNGFEALPDFLNVRLTRSKEQLAANEAAVKKQMEQFRNRSVVIAKPREIDVSKKPSGAKAEQVRVLREKRAVEVPAKKIVTPKAEPAKPEADTQESAMRKTKQTTKTASRSSARKPMKASTKSKAVKAPSEKKPSKSDVVHKMLTTGKGATREELSKATGWPHVNLKVAAQRAKMKLVEDGDRFKLVG